MKLSAAIALIATASAVRLMDEDEKTKELIEKTLDAETLGDLGDLTLEDLGEEGGECLLVSTGLTLLEHGVPEEIVAEVGEHMIAGAESGAPLSEGIEALRQLGEAYEAEAEAQDKVLGDILGKVKGCAEAALKAWEEEDGDDDDGTDGDDEAPEDDDDKSCFDDECSSGTDLAALAQKKGKLQGKLEELAGSDDEEDDDEDKDDEEDDGTDGDGEGPEDEEKSEIEEDGEDKDDEEDDGTDGDGEDAETEEKSEIEEDGEDKECVDDECSSGTDLAELAQKKGKLQGKLEDLAGSDDEDDEEDDDEDKDEDEEDDGTDGDGEGPEAEEKSEIEEDGEEKTCVDGECSSGTDLALAQIREEAAEVVDELAADVEKLIEEADLDEDDLEAALEHVAGKLDEAGVDGDKIAELGELLESGDLEALEEEVAALSEEARGKLMEAAEDIAGEIERKLGEKADEWADFKSDAGSALEDYLDLDDDDEKDE